MNFTVPGSCGPHAGEHLGGAHQHGDVHVVAAGVHHSRLAGRSIPSRASRRTEGRLLRSPAARPCRPQRHHRPGPAALAARRPRPSGRPRSSPRDRGPAGGPRRACAVRTSRLPSSGCWWRSRRQATTLGRIASARRSISAWRGGGLRGGRRGLEGKCDAGVERYGQGQCDRGHERLMGHVRPGSWRTVTSVLVRTELFTAGLGRRPAGSRNNRRLDVTVVPIPDESAPCWLCSCSRARRSSCARMGASTSGLTASPVPGSRNRRGSRSARSRRAGLPSDVERHCGCA